MQDEGEFQEGELDFSQHSANHSCPYCGELLSTEETGGQLDTETNTVTCPNCRKKINFTDLGREII